MAKMLTNNKDLATTLIGIGGAGYIWSQVDLKALAAGDTGQIGLVVFGGLVAVFGWLTNKQEG
jgi:hypothetical protein